MTSDEFICAKLAELAWNVAGHMSFPSCAAVMFCIRNQVEKNGDKDWIRVIQQNWGWEHLTPHLPDIRNPEFQKVLELVDSVYDGEKLDNLTNGALYFDGRGTERVAVVGTLQLKR